MSEMQSVRELLVGAFEGPNWYGPPLRRILEGVGAEEANAVPVPGWHSIRQLVRHVTGWIREGIKTLEGRPFADPASWDWRPVEDPSDASWRADLEALEAAHGALLAAVDAFPADRLREELRDGSGEPLGFTFLGVLQGLAQHGAYHGAQIVVLRRFLGTGR